MAQNPYSTPVASTSAIPDRGVLQNASQNKRFLGYIIDQIILSVMSYGGGFVLGTLYVGGRPQITQDEATMLRLLGSLLGLAITIIFYLVCESVTRRTVGKLVTGTKVVNQSGGPPTFMQILGRTFARCVPFEPLSFFWGCNTKFPTGWHDRWSGTRVVDVKIT